MTEPESTYDPSTAMRWLLAALSIGAGAIHLAMVPQHAQEALRMGLAFAVAGWFQLAFGIAIVARPRQLWVQLAVAGNLLFIATWVISRTSGLPSWTGDGGVEDASSVDLLCVGLEVALVLGAIALLLAPNLLREWPRPALLAAAVIPIGILVATTAVLASPSAADHAHDEGDDHDHPEVATEAATEVAADDGHTAAATTSGTEHSHEAGTAAVAPPTPTTAHRSDTTVPDPAADHHPQSDIAYDQLPPETRAQVDQVIAAFATRYPTGADAERDGWFKATKSLYGIGAHYVRTTGLSVATEFDLLNPNILLFDGEGPDARFAGVSYVTSGGAPEGFIGDYDTWHGHSSVCLAGGTVVSLIEEGSSVWLSESDCAERGGNVLPLGGAEQMMHLWIGPGYLETGPIMAHDHPLLLDGYNPQLAE